MRGSSIGKGKQVPRKKELTRKLPRHLYLQPLGARAPSGHLMAHFDRVGTSPKVSEGLHYLKWFLQREVVRCEWSQCVATMLCVEW